MPKLDFSKDIGNKIEAVVFGIFQMEQAEPA
jgi:hypothetical protein